MIIVRLIGGLGNQLFQYALGRCISHKKKKPLKLDISWYQSHHKGHPLRSYKLNHFNISAEIASLEEVQSITGKDQKGIENRFLSLLQQYLPYYKRTVLLEQQSTFDPNVFKARGNVYLKGHWHSEKYFQDVGKLIQKEFTLKRSLQGQSAMMAQEIKSRDSVSIHIRRGDYVTNPVARRKYFTCSADYYFSAIDRIKQFVPKPYMYVFSDDISWVKKNINFTGPVVFVEHLGVDRDYEALYLMSLCKHHIIANSSFSWWGAWLGSDPEKTVIAPKKWFNDPTRDTSDLIPERWVRL